MIYRKKIYIAGAVISCDCQEAMKRFLEAEKEINSRGDIAVNPTLLCKETNSWSECMRKKLKALLDCDEIYMLKGWRKSKDAKLEHFVALKLGINIILEK